jgi:hypothetical protein
MEQESYQKAERRSAEADQDHLQAALTTVSNQGLRRINSHGEECYRAEC